MNGLPPVMKKGCWESGPTKFGSFEFKGETITIDSEEKYLYWDKNLIFKIMIKILMRWSKLMT